MLKRTSLESQAGRLAVKNLEVGYGSIPIVRGASVEVEPNRIVGIIGPNGAGKSTFLKGVMGILPPRAGTVVYDGRPLQGLRPDQIVSRGIGYVPQLRDVFDNLTVAENLDIGGHIARAGRNQRKDEIYSQFPVLAERRHQSAHTLSGGQRRLLALARALMSKPRVILLDEPSAGLSPQAMDTVWEHLGKLKDQGLALLIVEQKARALLSIADWVYVLVDGRNAVDASGAVLLDDIANLGKIFMGGSESNTDNHVNSVIH
ncbi:ABC transporter ATP-binding protein [Sulfobacillus harzensis]|uniref:ABC transporter ATP-binding protein n=1 Tax=Sulfobacillus harzensis TaxID=2729629 RepID=A0A7Y0Q4K7_9FIRM|nr:ABC transporter ATP-binding protein [Sulfobacillus harzensis]NMP24121.1 ABC transporter ATP-binding protein [Sulfobacillus harzensis]